MPDWSKSEPCPSCRLPMALCVCSLAPRVKTSTAVTLVMHCKEWKRSSNTGRFVPLAIEGARTVFHGERDHRLTAADLYSESHPIVLFPGCGAKPLTAELAQSLARPLTLIVPDGNWNQAKHMMRRLPPLERLPVYELPGPTPDRRRMRRNIFEGRMSTFEAIVHALSIVEGTTEWEPQLLDFFATAIDRMLMLRGKLKAADVYGGLPSSLDTPLGVGL